MRIAFAALSLALAFPAHPEAQELRPAYRELQGLGEGSVSSVVESPSGHHVLYQFQDGSGSAESRIAGRGAGESLSHIELTEPDWSPRGDQIAFTKLDESGQNLHVWTLPVDSRTGRANGPPRRVSVRSGRGPTFSPDGRWIAFTGIPAADTATPRIVVIPAAGGPEKILVHAAGWTQDLHWSGDGEWIYYRYNPTPHRPETVVLARVSARGGDPKMIRPIRDFLGMSSDGRLLAYVPPGAAASPGRTAIGISNTDGTEVGRFSLPRTFVPAGWAVSGAKMLAVRNDVRTGLRALSMRGGPARDLTGGGSHARSPVWSPDSRRIAHLDEIDGRIQIVVADARGGVRRRVSTEHEPDAGTLLWSPDGRRIAFLSTTPRSRLLHVVELASGAETQVASAEEIDAVAWRLNSGAVLFARDGATGQELWEVTLNGAGRKLRSVSGELAGGRITFVGDSAIVATAPGGLYVGDVRRSTSRRLYMPRDGESELPIDRLRAEVSPDGRYALLVGLAPMGGNGVQDAVRLIPLDGSPLRVLPLGVLWHSFHFAWHPDGQHLLTLGRRNQKEANEVLLIPLNGGPHRRLTSGSRMDVSQFSLSPDGAALVYGGETGATASLWEVDLAGFLRAAAASQP